MSNTFNPQFPYTAKVIDGGEGLIEVYNIETGQVALYRSNGHPYEHISDALDLFSLTPTQVLQVLAASKTVTAKEERTYETQFAQDVTGVQEGR